MQLKLQGLDLSSAKKQVGTSDDFRRSYSLQGAMQVCVCVRASFPTSASFLAASKAFQATPYLQGIYKSAVRIELGRAVGV